MAKKRLDARIVAPIAFDIFQLMGLFERTWPPRTRAD
jgi:hypothetical protein